MKIISFTICPFVQRVTALLEAKKVPYDIEYISLSDKPDWFLELSPNGQVPLLVTDSGQALFESDAIAEYIDEVTTPLQPNLTPEQKAINRAWSYQATKHYLTQCSTMRSKDEETLKERGAKLISAFEKAEKALNEGPFFSGEEISNVDIAWLPLLHRAHIVKQYTGFDFLSDLPKTQKWQKKLMETGVAEKSVSEEFITKFTNFYLSEETELGRKVCCDTDCCEENRGNCCDEGDECCVESKPSLSINKVTCCAPDCC
ncbi:glutathione S-transferase [Vibrio nigripulchritudo ATCC 27043]|uniref:glutathione S-transferase family protein n=1 Tax=Vibrio nigripulchritudo TaxID=28173 RepID=UPI00021C1EB2|nr:glutathione S-transferase family protein [Vibrio nigripulchritudo]EGU61735.1 glutathione S-transferase [Vibrio nigripulchritudo ATCC 27043]